MEDDFEIYEIKLDPSKMNAVERELYSKLEEYKTDVFAYGEFLKSRSSDILKDPDIGREPQEKNIKSQIRIERLLRDYDHIPDNDKVGLYHLDDYSFCNAGLYAMDLMAKGLNPKFVTTDERRHEIDSDFRKRVDAESRETDMSFG